MYCAADKKGIAAGKSMRRTHSSLLFSVAEACAAIAADVRGEGMKILKRNYLVLIQKGDCLWLIMIYGNLFAIWSSGDF